MANEPTPNSTATAPASQDGWTPNPAAVQVAARTPQQDGWTPNPAAVQVAAPPPQQDGWTPNPATAQAAPNPATAQAAPEVNYEGPNWFQRNISDPFVDQVQDLAQRAKNAILKGEGPGWTPYELIQKFSSDKQIAPPPATDQEAIDRLKARNAAITPVDIQSEKYMIDRMRWTAPYRMRNIDNYAHGVEEQKIINLQDLMTPKEQKDNPVLTGLGTAISGLGTQGNLMLLAGSNVLGFVGEAAAVSPKLGMMAKVVGATPRLISAYFTLNMGAGIVKALPGLIGLKSKYDAAIKANDPEKAADILWQAKEQGTELATGAYFTYASAYHAATGEAEPVGQHVASSVKETVQYAAEKGVEAAGNAADYARDAAKATSNMLGTATDLAKTGVQKVALLGKATRTSDAINRVITPEAPKKQREAVRQATQDVEPDLDAILQKNEGEISDPKTTAKAIRDHLQEQEKTMQQEAGATRDSKEPVVTNFQQRLAERIDKFFQDNPIRYGSDEEVAAAKKDIMDRMTKREQVGVDPETGEPVYDRRAPNLYEAEDLRQGLNDETSSSFKANAKPITNAYRAAAIEGTRFLRSMIDESYDAHGIGNVEEFRKKEAKLSTIASLLESAQDRALKAGEPGWGSAIWSKIGATEGLITILASMSLHSPPALLAAVPGLVVAKAHQNLTNPISNIERAVDLAKQNPNAVATGIETKPPLPPVQGPEVAPRTLPTPAPSPTPTMDHNLYSALSTYFGHVIGAVPLDELEGQFIAQIQKAQEDGKPVNDRQAKLLAKVNDAKARQRMQFDAANQKAAVEQQKAAQKAADEQQKAADQKAAEQKTAAEGAAAEKNEKDLTAHIAIPFEPGEEMPISKRWQSLVEGISGPRIRAHELGHHIMAALAGWLTGDVIGENHPKLSGGKNSLAEARWDDHPFYDEKGKLDLGKVTDNLDQLLDLFHGGAIAEEIVHGVPMAENYGATGDLGKMRGLLKDAGLKPAEIGAAMKASELRVRQIMSTPGVRDIIDRYTKSREAGLRDDVHMSDETVAKAVEEVKTLLGGGENGTNNEGKAANGLRGGAEKGEAGRVGGNAPKNEGEAGAAREKGASAGSARRGTDRVGGVTEKTKANVAEPEMKVEHRDNAMGGDVRLEGPEGNHGYVAYTHDGKDAEIRVSMIEKGERGKGYGQKAYETIADKVRAKGGERLHSDPEETSPDAARVWEKLSAKHPGEITKDADGRYTWDLKKGGETKANIAAEPKTISDKLVDTYGTTDDPHAAGFILSDGRMVPLHDTHNAMLENLYQKYGDIGMDEAERTHFINAEKAVRTRYRMTKGGQEVVFSVPKDGVNEAQINQIKQSVGKMRNGNAVMEISEGEGKSTKKEFARVSDVEPMLREIGALPEGKDLKANLGHEAMAGLKASRESEQAAEKENTDKQIAAHEANGGSTFTPQGENLAGKDLYAVGSYPERGRVVDTLTPEALNKFKADNADLLAKGDHAVGSWKDPETGKVALDISKTYADRDEAIAAGKAANQKAIYHLGTGETVNTGGTGENPNEMLKANIGGPLSDDPTQFRKQIEAVSKGDLEPAEMHDIYELMRKEAARNLARAKANRQNWHSDYWSGNLKKINAAIRELGPRESSGGPSLKANIAAEPKEEEGFNFGKNAEGTPDQQKGLISTALPKGKKAIADPLETDVRVGMESLTPKSEAAIADKIREMPGFRIPDAIKDPKKVIAKYIDQFKKNLIDVHNRVDPETRAATAKWYESANGIARRTAEKFGKTLKQGAGILAALSPQKDWDQNVSLAERVNDIYHTKGDMRMTPEMRAKVDQLVGEKHTDEEGNVTRKNDKLGNLVDSIGDRTFNELSNPLEKAAFIRLYDEAHNPREFHRIDPGTGNRAEIVTTDSGAPRRIAWGSLNEISKAVSILEDGSRENISNNLGGSHKVRNFYNNILDPNNPAGHVTVDTHAVAAGHQRMLGGNSPEVAANFGGISAAETGLKGMYAVNAEAYRQAAKELGLQPRQLQSIVWEEIRKQFPDEYKRSKPAQAAIDGIWKEYEDGDITLKNAQQRVRDYAQKGYAEMVANKPAAKAAAKPQVNWDWEKIGLLPSNFVKSGK